MKERTLQYHLRAFASPHRNSTQWICRRCLATEPASSSSPMPPPSLPIKKAASEAANYDPHLPSTARDYRLTTTDFYLKKALPHRIPPQYLHHSTTDLLQPSEAALRTEFQNTLVHNDPHGVVVSSGKMDRTVKVRVPGQTWNKKIKKYFNSHTTHLVHDPNNSLVTGDVIKLHRLHVTSNVRYVVASIISPFGTPIDQRPPVPTPDERLALYKEKRFAKLHRRSLRREAAKGNADAIAELKNMGLDPGKGVEAGKGGTANVQKGVGKKRTPTPKDGAVVGSKGQKLPEGVLPGGKHEVGKINERARRNKESAMKMEAKAEEDLREAEAKEQDLSDRGLRGESVVPRQGPFVKREGMKEDADGRSG